MLTGLAGIGWFFIASDMHAGVRDKNKQRIISYGIMIIF
jgi:hypothetical protein